MPESRAATLKPATDFMFSSIRALPPVLALVGCGVLFLFPGGCRKPKPLAAIAPPVEIAPELTTNLLADSPSTMLADQAQSPVHWQPFRKETFERAERANRLVFGVICQPRQPGYLAVIRAIERDAGLVRDVNDKFVSGSRASFSRALGRDQTAAGPAALSMDESARASGGLDPG
ncbi:MAG: hypothetical protein CFE26_21120 [Verrucomicrobiales bacterium VVV1]|nr:MAG: hypothetical protein CFE26_21120 [Verrucomicrobiales bacterium VVV1]